MPKIYLLATIIVPILIVYINLLEPISCIIEHFAHSHFLFLTGSLNLTVPSVIKAEVVYHNAASQTK